MCSICVIYALKHSCVWYISQNRQNHSSVTPCSQYLRILGQKANFEDFRGKFPRWHQFFRNLHQKIIQKPLRNRLYIKKSTKVNEILYYLNCVDFYVNFCRIFDYIYLIVTLLILKIHSSCPLKPLQVPPDALKTDSFQGLRPWTPSGGLHRPPNP